MVNFKPTDEQELVRETMAGFAREVLRSAAREADEKGTVPEDVVNRGREHGLVQSGIPEQHGGYGD
jgi:alkylation response protein AidB-like acyl-CoA dehydrogenase